MRASGSPRGSDERRSVKIRYTWILVGVALAVRFAYLIYNIQLALPDGWHLQARAVLYYSQYLTGTPLTPTDMSLEEATRFYQYDDSGMVYIHWVIAKLFGKTTFLHVQVLQLIIDAGLVIPIMKIGQYLGGTRVSLVSGLAYALFLPQIHLAAVPGYDFWASFGFIVSTWLFLDGRRYIQGENKRWLTRMLIGSIVVALAGSIQSTIIYYSLLYAGVFPFLCRTSWRKKGLVIVVIVSGWTVGFVPKLIHNYRTYGEVKVIRGTVGHNFWVGVGQFPNPYGVITDDGDIARFYRELSGRIGQDPWDVGYNQFLLEKAKEYVRAYPLQYVRSAVRRAVRILSGSSMRNAGLIADTWTFWRIKVTEKLEGAKLLNQVVRRMLYLVLPLLPLGFVIGVMCRRSPDTWLAALPMVYTLATLAPFYFTWRNVVSAHAAVLPVSVYGLYIGYEAACRYTGLMGEKLGRIFPQRRNGAPRS